ncbi:NAD(P)/FAD-dependent oxidoreductase [Arthrobacter sp. GCM10027362]|uniref:NAD(P)/FAD-dependent oxidoreductase n=1 Tax=Arthrobacter sp. GCM10027362 TaxID=3273379 RepID=UPI00363F514A
MPSQTVQKYDVVIVGGGIAGLSAALVLGRARRKVAVVDAGQPRNRVAGHVHGFPTRDGASPAELLKAAREEVYRYGVELIAGTVAKVATGLRLELSDGNSLHSRHVILAGGLQDVLPDLEGASDCWGRDLLQCPYCHGWEVRDRRLGVLGTSESSVQQALLVRQWSDRVTFFPHTSGDPAASDAAHLAARGVQTVSGQVRRLVSNGDGLTGLEVDGAGVVPCDALFIEPGSAVDRGVAAALDCSYAEDGCLTTDDLGRTSVERVWAAGNATDPAAQLVSAAGDAYRVAVSVNAELVREDVEAAMGQPVLHHTEQ